jgi:hypothetical protein
MYLQTGDERQWMARERQSLEARPVARPVMGTTSGKSRWTAEQSVTCWDLGAAVGLAAVWVGRLFGQRPAA